MTIKNKLYNGDVILNFDGFRHKYTVDDEPVPSVTTVLGIIAKPQLINWAAYCAVDSVASALEAGKAYDELELSTIFDTARKAHYQKKVDAGNIGTFIHKWIEDYIKGTPQGMPVNEDLKDSINHFLTWVEKYKVKFLLSEQMTYSKKYKYAGTTDFICTINGDMYIGDTKTSSGIYPESLIQTSAYRYARSEEFPEEKYKGQLIINIQKSGDFIFGVVRDDAIYQGMFKGFLSALNLYKTMEWLKLYKPDSK